MLNYTDNFQDHCRLHSCPISDNMKPSTTYRYGGGSNIASTSAVLLFLTVLLAAVHFLSKRLRKSREPLGKALPGPRPWPLLGSLHYLGMFDIPFEGFTYLKKFYGDVFSMRLGSTDCVIVNTPELRDEAIVAKANDFDGRPQFDRFRILFGGGKDNSLAFCDFSPLHEKRRALISHYSLPHSHSNSWERMNAICQEECWTLESYIEKTMSASATSGITLDIKPILLKACGNVFNRYFCDSPHYDYDDSTFSTYVSDFELIFWEVNNGRFCDFSPWATFTATSSISKARKHAESVRHFVKNCVVAPRLQQSPCGTEKEEVLLDYLLPSLTGEKSQKSCDLDQTEMDADMAMYALEDILGGHTAIACMAIRVIWDVLKNPETVKEIRAEIARVEAAIETAEAVYSMTHSERFHWARAAIFESVRLTCSPIVPHRATRDTTIGGYDVKAETVLFINNHELSMSEKYWGEDANTFRASRFLVPRDNSNNVASDKTSSSDAGDLVFRRPSHFKPFSLGKRACMGYKIVEHMTLVLLVALFKNYDLCIDEKSSKIDIQGGMLALPLSPMELNLRRRSS